MKRITLLLLFAASAALAQTTAKPATHTATAAKPATHAAAAKPATHAAGAKPAADCSTASQAVPEIKLPAGVPAAGPGSIVQTAFALRFQDIKVGEGPVAEPGKLFKVHYTGWLAADGRKFDSSYDHRTPVMDKDGKPVMGDDGKPKQGDPQPLIFPQGYGRLIPGFDQGVAGMKIGGKRRLFIPWQLAYGAHERPGPDAAHPGIPAMADLIFDVELLDTADLQMPAAHPGMTGMPSGHPAAPQGMPHPATAAPATPPAATTQPAAPAQPVTPAEPK